MTPDAESGRRASRVGTRVVVGLGNPGPEYDDTRHNVGWWVLDRFAYDHDFEPFERRPRRLETTRRIGGRSVVLVKPRTYMNRSGQALTTLWRIWGFDLESHLLVVADDANLDVGRVRLRPGGGAGGHNGLKSVTAALGTPDYARMRVGVGTKPPGADLSAWVLSPMPAEDEDVVTALLPELSRAVAVWADEGIETAMNRFNR
ncbi:MAG: aminoacyl-tRNA hydrolase [Gemmatimonadetes bacterium]|nr:aminoacyl-tRNA hydrolase [Gemmatimonadota bacterium]MYD12660.1 aminoacyl-tRNA hydrolase [Gemmatimonadota bacterium]MYI64587.1 aminoacyl-tRNA hydrolase [Gemmatimonadota bacterium]